MFLEFLNNVFDKDMVGQKQSQLQHYSVYKEEYKVHYSLQNRMLNLCVNAPIGNGKAFLLVTCLLFCFAPLDLLVNGRVPEVQRDAREWWRRLLANSPATLSLEATDSLQIQTSSQCTQFQIVAILGAISNQWSLIGMSWQQFTHAAYLNLEMKSLFYWQSMEPEWPQRFLRWLGQIQALVLFNQNC